MLEQLAEKWIRKRVSENCYDVSKHAQKRRMAERQIDIEEVIECILQGQTIEFQLDKETNDIKVIFQEATSENPEIYVIVVALDTPLIVTACRTIDEDMGMCGWCFERRRDYSR